MIKPYIVELESRVKTLQQLIGDTASYEKDSKQCKQRVDEIVAKISGNKDTQRKYQKVTNFIQKYSDSLDTMYTGDKVNIVVDELDTLNQTATVLNKIQKLLPALDTQVYNKNCDQYNNIDLLNTASSLKLQSNNVQVVSYNPMSLQMLQQQQRKQMNAIMELNYRMINNLNEKLKLAYQKKMRK